MLDSSERLAGLRVDEVIARLELKPGDTVADLGAGTGPFVAPFAKAVPSGQVYAVEIDSGFFPLILEPRRRIDQALYAVVMEAYVNGVSTRSVDDLVAALGIDSGISKSEVSRICAGLDEEMAAWR